MPRKFRLLALFILIALLLPACGEGAPAETPTPEPSLITSRPSPEPNSELSPSPSPTPTLTPSPTPTPTPTPAPTPTPTPEPTQTPEPTPHPDPFIYKELVEIHRLDPTIVLDLKYATEDNFTGAQIYDVALALLHTETAEKLVAANAYFRTLGYAIKIWDAYRPVAAQWALYHATPDHLKHYAPRPSNLSQHCKGIAVDITLVYIETGEELEMPTEFDTFSEKAHPDCMDLSDEAIENRGVLISGMRAAGFLVNQNEWWHFYLPGKSAMPISDVEFADYIQARDAVNRG